MCWRADAVVMLKGHHTKDRNNLHFLKKNQVSLSYWLLKGQSELDAGLLNENQLSTKIICFLCMFIFFFVRWVYVIFKKFYLLVHTILRHRGFMPPWNPKPTLLLQRYNLENMIQDVPKLIDDSYWFLLICTLYDHLHSVCTMCWLWHPNPDSYALPIWAPVPLPPLHLYSPILFWLAILYCRPAPP